MGDKIENGRTASPRSILFTSRQFSVAFIMILLEWVGNPSETDSVSSQISPRTYRGKKDSTKRRHQRHHQRQPCEQLFPVQVVTG